MILIQDWRVLKTGSWKEGGRQQLTKEGHLPLDDSDRWRDRDEAKYDHHRNLHRKSKEADCIKTIIRADESRITTPSVATAGFGGVTPPVAKRLFAPGCKTPQVYPKAAGGQQDICTMLQYTSTYSPAEEADREAMEEDILQQKQEEANKANRIQVLREKFEKESRLNVSSINKMKGITWSAETGEGPTMTAPQDHLSTNRGSRFRKATKTAREIEQAQAQEAKLKELNGVSTYEFSDSSSNAVISDVFNGLESQKQKRQKEGTAYISRNSSRTVRRPGYLLDKVGAQVEKKRGRQKGGKLKG